MTAFIWVAIIVAAIELLASLAWLAKSDYPTMTREDAVFGVIWSVIIIVWAVALLT